MDDLISRQAAIDAVKHAWAKGLEPSQYIEALPPAEPQRMRGKWIDAEIHGDNSILPVQVCDQCNTFFPLAYTGGGHNYCPNCGADMREETTNDKP